MKTQNQPSCIITLILSAILGGYLLEAAAADVDLPARDAVKPVVPLRAVPFALEDVRLRPGPFFHAMELDQKYLLALDVDRLLHNFRINAGLPSAARPLGGWEEPKIELRGHFTGHYLTACALMYASTGDARFKEKGDAVVAGLSECQRKLGSGYLSAFPEEFIDRVESRRRVWAPWYTLHKILAGLLDMTEYCGNAEALDVARKFADWVQKRTDCLSDEQMQAMLGNEHGGMNEALANLYARTGEPRYLKLADRFNHKAVLGPAAERRDTLTGLHANTQIPKFIGTAVQYELTGKDWYKSASDFFWNTVVKERSYVIGGHSDGEMFSPKEKLSQALGPDTTETCNTYNMLKLTRHLFEWDPRPEYADYYERALYNHILASQNPETGMMCYYVPLRSGSRKVYNGFDDAFWCCTGTGVENHAKYGDSIYFHDGDRTLFVNLFIASDLDWKAKGLKLRQETGYPEDQKTKLTVTCSAPVRLAIKVRRPVWASEGFKLAINGVDAGVASRPGEYATIDRTWTGGDTVEVALPFRLRTEGFADNPGRLAFLHGPLVLAAPIDTSRPVPAIVTEPSRLLASLKPVPGKPSTFAGSPEVFRLPGGSAGEGVTLEPFYKIHGDRHYVVYWDTFTAERWKDKEAEYAAELSRSKELDRRTVDQVKPGEEQNERDHKFEGEKTSAGTFGNRGWRHADDGGHFRYTVKVLPHQPQELSVTYWGSDRGRRVFDLLIDGKKIATETLENNRPEQFYDQTYPLPEELTKGKSQVTVTFQAQPRQTAGGVFGVRVLMPK
ncbi:MAG: glycoside hydrolase family 127 protein [Isosphaeraceae bacterium]